MLKIKSQNNNKKSVEAEVIKVIEKQGYNLNTVNNYDENLLHISAANGCYEIAKKILDRKESCHVINRKNKFGWTPLMQAIRNGDINTVKLLLEKNSSVNESTYLGMSVLGLAAAISKEMFETVYNACPNALANAASDDISPLCVAAMKNDKELLFKLIELGMPLSSANEYTNIMMRNSTVPEIAALAKEPSIIEDYWNDISDNIRVECEQDIDETTKENNPCNDLEPTKELPKSIFKNDEKKKQRPDKLKLLSVPVDLKQDLMSPDLAYNCGTIFSSSPNVYFRKLHFMEKSNTFFKDKDTNEEVIESDLEKYPKIIEYQFESPSARNTTLQRLQSEQSINLDITNVSDDLNVTLEFMPEFSPLKSPNVPSDINENAFGENTPTPPRCKTPPKGMLLNTQQTKMVVVLKRFGLGQHIPIFLEQEVDIDLFLTLTNDDLIEIGIKHEEDRYALLDAINEYKRGLKDNNNGKFNIYK